MNIHPLNQLLVATERFIIVFKKTYRPYINLFKKINNQHTLIADLNNDFSTGYVSPNVKMLAKKIDCRVPHLTFAIFY